MKRLKHLLMAVLVVLPVVACDDDTIVVPPPVEGTISGTVTIDGQAASGVTMNLSGAATGQATTGPNGAFSFTGLDEGNYVVDVVAPANVTFNLGSQTASISQSNTSVNLTPFVGNTVATGRIEGIIQVPDGSGGFAGVNGVTVTLSGSGSDQAVSQNGGLFAFNNLVAGTYTVTIPGTFNNLTFPDPVRSGLTVTAGQTQPVVFTANTPPPAGTILGRVTVDNDGASAAGITINLTGADNRTVTLQTVDDGNFAFSGLGNGSYNVSLANVPGTVLFPNGTTRSITLSNASPSASVDFGGVTITPATVSLESITQVLPGGATVPANTDNVFGQIVVRTEVDEGDEQVSRLELFFEDAGGTQFKFADQTFSVLEEEEAESDASFDFAASENTAKFTFDQGAGTPPVIRYFNDLYKIIGKITTNNGVRTAVLSQNDLKFNNADTYVGGRAPANSVVTAGGRAWTGGPGGFLVDIYGLNFSGRSMATAVANYNATNAPAVGADPAAASIGLTANAATTAFFAEPIEYQTSTAPDVTNTNDFVVITAGTYTGGDPVPPITGPGPDGILGTPDDEVGSSTIATNVFTDAAEPTAGTLVHTTQFLGAGGWPTDATDCCEDQWYNANVPFSILAFNGTSPSDGTGVGLDTATDMFNVSPNGASGIPGAFTGSFAPSDVMGGVPGSDVNDSHLVNRTIDDLLANSSPASNTLPHGRDDKTPIYTSPIPTPTVGAHFSGMINATITAPTDLWVDGSIIATDIGPGASGFTADPIRVTEIVNGVTSITEESLDALFTDVIDTPGYNSIDLEAIYDASGNPSAAVAFFQNLNDIVAPGIAANTIPLNFLGGQNNPFTISTDATDGSGDILQAMAVLAYDTDDGAGGAPDGTIDFTFPFGTNVQDDGTPFTGTPVTSLDDEMITSPFVEALQRIDGALAANVDGDLAATPANTALPEVIPGAVGVAMLDHGGNASAVTIPVPTINVDPVPGNDFWADNAADLLAVIMDKDSDDLPGSLCNGGVGFLMPPSTTAADAPSAACFGTGPTTFSFDVTLEVTDNASPNPLAGHTLWFFQQDGEGNFYNMGTTSGSTANFFEIAGAPDRRFWQIDSGTLTAQRGASTDAAGGGTSMIWVVATDGSGAGVVFPPIAMPITN